MNILVAIANHGTKNTQYLDRVLREFRALTRYHATLVVFSDVPKALGPDVEVKVGTPIKDPWSLPFGHKQLFAERIDQYDLFIYSEDDTLIGERQLDAFLEATDVLPPGYIAGFLRYEVGADGTRSYPDMHGPYHWDANSVFQAGGRTFAYHSNEHSACYIVTRRQLKTAIASGGFVLPPRKGRYDMLVTAATDPYTRCGMRKVIGISDFDAFSLHHLPNVYCGKLGMAAVEAEREVDHLLSLPQSDTVRGPLFESRTLLDDVAWDKCYYMPRQEDVIAAVPAGVKKLLSVGCGCGTTEAALAERGIEVVAIPMDTVVAATAAAKGIRLTEPDLGRAMTSLDGERFDCVLLMDVLHHFERPVHLLRELRALATENCVFVARVPNCRHPSVVRSPAWRRALLSSLCHGDEFKYFGFHLTGPRSLSTWFKRAGFQPLPPATSRPAIEWTMSGLAALVPRRSVVRAVRKATPA